jgi:lipoprotein signal peptidase
MDKPRVELVKKKWVDDFLDDIVIVGYRLIIGGAYGDKVDKAVREFIQELSPEFYEINISYNAEKQRRKFND